MVQMSCRYILNDVECSSDSVEKRSEELREKITTIRKCDLKDKHLLGKDYEGILYSSK